jgi:ribosomal protein L13E
MWTRRDWDAYYSIARRQRWTGKPPLRPVDRASRNRLVPTEGYSLAELDEAGLSVEKAEGLGLPVDIGRVGSYGPNVSVLRAFLAASRRRF